MPLYILGSSLFGAQLAAGSGFRTRSPHISRRPTCSPPSLPIAVTSGRQHQLAEPHVIAGVNAIAAESEEDAAEQFQRAMRQRLRALARPGLQLSDEQVDAVLAGPEGQRVRQMAVYSAVGRPDDVRDYLEAFAKHADADELIIAFQSPSAEDRLRSAELVAEVLLNQP